jgi:hypothetical protein
MDDDLCTDCRKALEADEDAKDVTVSQPEDDEPDYEESEDEEADEAEEAWMEDEEPDDDM